MKNISYPKNIYKGLFKKGSLFIFVFILMFISFVSGVYTGEMESSPGKDIINNKNRPLSITVGSSSQKNISSNELTDSEKEIDFELYWELWNTLKDDYVDGEEIKDKDLFYGSLEGMASALNDPYTLFMDPEDAEKFENGLNGTFEGIGCEVGIRDEALTVIAPLDGSPAEKAGLLSGDKIIAVEDEPTIDMSIDESVKKIRGEKGKEVTLTVYRESKDETFDVDIVRDEIYIKSLKTEMREDDIFVLDINNFNEDTLKLFNEAVNKIKENNPKGVILDLRNNPGGFLDTSVEVSSEWVEDGKIVSEVFSTGREKNYYARGKASLKDYSTIVLVNGGSASASEIVAGALQDYDKATIVGEKTFGKGSVQSLEKLSDGSSVKITIAKWKTPNGNYINDDGITPDKEVEYSFEDFKANNDVQLKKAVEILNKN